VRFAKVRILNRSLDLLAAFGNLCPSCGKNILTVSLLLFQISFFFFFISKCKFYK